MWYHMFVKTYRILQHKEWNAMYEFFFFNLRGQDIYHEKMQTLMQVQEILYYNIWNNLTEGIGGQESCWLSGLQMAGFLSGLLAKRGQAASVASSSKEGKKNCM